MAVWKWCHMCQHKATPFVLWSQARVLASECLHLYRFRFEACVFKHGSAVHVWKKWKCLRLQYFVKLRDGAKCTIFVVLVRSNNALSIVLVWFFNVHNYGSSPCIVEESCSTWPIMLLFPVHEVHLFIFLYICTFLQLLLSNNRPQSRTRISESSWTVSTCLRRATSPRTFEGFFNKTIWPDKRTLLLLVLCDCLSLQMAAACVLRVCGVVSSFRMDLCLASCIRVYLPFRTVSCEKDCMWKCIVLVGQVQAVSQGTDRHKSYCLPMKTVIHVCIYSLLVPATGCSCLIWSQSSQCNQEYSWCNLFGCGP